MRSALMLSSVTRRPASPSCIEPPPGIAAGGESGIDFERIYKRQTAAPPTESVASTAAASVAISPTTTTTTAPRGGRVCVIASIDAPGRIRTCGLFLRREALYPAELRAPKGQSTSRRLATMDLSVAFLGTGGAVPSARRNTAGVLIARGGERLLFDCGEGTQRQMQRSLGLVQVDAIYFTHFHADHFLGLPGLLKTYDLTERERPLTIYGPRGLRDLIKSLGRVIGRVGYKIDLVELEPGEAIPCDGAEVRAFGVEHSVRAIGYSLVEAERPGRFDLEAAKRLGVEEGPDFAALQRGESVPGAAGTVEPGEVRGESRPGRTAGITGDTAPRRGT